MSAYCPERTRQVNRWNFFNLKIKQIERLALDGEHNWLTLGLVKLLFKLVVSGAVDIPPAAGCWTCCRFLTVSTNSWLLTDNWTLRVRTCLFFWRNEPCWRSVSLNRRSWKVNSITTGGGKKKTKTNMSQFGKTKQNTTINGFLFSWIKTWIKPGD